MKALLSVSNKEGIAPFARALVDLGWELLSTGGTLSFLHNEGIAATEVADYTGFPEMFEGRIKTLHPKIHGGILFRGDSAQQVEAASLAGIERIGLVCVTLYPFEETASQGGSLKELIEQIDIGGPAMIRSAAKNSEEVYVLTDKVQYEEVLEDLRRCAPHSEESSALRRRLMIQALSRTASYDAFIARTLSLLLNGEMGDFHLLQGRRTQTLRYGENPHQKGALYETGDFFRERFVSIQGEPSFNNIGDLTAGVRIAALFPKEPGVCLIKHANPCGFALKGSLIDSYTAALRCDPLSAFGGLVALNGVVDQVLARHMNQTFYEVIVARGFTEEAKAEFAPKKRLKLFEIQGEWDTLPFEALEVRQVLGGFMVQERDRVESREWKDAKRVSEHSLADLEDLKIAWHLVAQIKSNAVVYVRDGAALAIGMGMTSRVDATRCAIKKASESGLSLEGSVMASEAFFPFRDSVDAAHEVGVSAIIQPGGSVRDEEVIRAANEHKIALYFTGVRHFLH